MSKFNTMNFALACGFAWALGIFLLGLAASSFGYASPIVALMGTGYLGYAATIPGSIIGAGWGFVDGFIGGFIFSWIYNKLQESRK